MSKPRPKSERCEHCWHDPRSDEIIDAGGFRIDPRGTLQYQGKPVEITRGMVSVLHAIAQEEGRIITVSGIGESCSGEAESNSITALICKMRKRFTALGIPDPVGSKHGVPGYWWAVS